ncbi:MAG: DUF1800 family protein [Acidobacteriota bacterium]|nr:DUF1800 family protein [Acidobacteriota bacterium]
MFLFPAVLQAQSEPCGFYEIDGQSGFDDGDIFYAASIWLKSGSAAEPADFDGNDTVNILDMVSVGGCIRNLGRGLLARYYGFENGDPEQDIAFPNFDALPGNPDPVVVNAVDRFDEIDDYEDFLGSHMRHQFGAVYTGYLFVPEDARYTFTIQGRRGARLYVGGVQRAAFDGWPENGSGGVILDYGLHPIRLEFYTDGADPRLSLAWRSTGDIIGPLNTTILPDYLYHQGTTIPEDSVSELRVIMDPPSGVRVSDSLVPIKAYVIGADTDTRLWIGGNERTLQDGYYERTIGVVQGLNHIDIRAEDSDGRVVEFPYSLYLSKEVSNSGIAVNIYPVEWYGGALPSIEGRTPVATATSPTLQLETENDGGTNFNGRRVYRNTVVSMVGALSIPNPGWYRFRINEQGALFINGQKVAAIGYDYEEQYDSRGEIELPAGVTHFQLITGSRGRGPEIDVYWSYEGGSEVRIPNGLLRHGPQSFDTITPLANRGSAGRSQTAQIAEYLFREGNHFFDGARNGFDLRPDPRAFPRSTGGLTYLSPGTLSSVPAGSRLGAEAYRNDGIAVEVDFITDEIVDWNWRYLISLTNPRWNDYASLYLRNNDIYFIIDDGDGEHTLVAENVVTAGQRLHVVGTSNGLRNRIWINGVIAEEEDIAIDFGSWENMLQLNVGQAYRRTRDPGTSKNQLIGTFLAAAAYGRVLTPSEVSQNRNANLALHSPPGPVPQTAAVTFPPAGTSQAELDEAFHILNRMSFGPSPESINELLNMGATAWINQQLNPDTIDDSALEADLASGMFNPEHGYRDLTGQMLYRMIRSKRQLLEVMTWFWENHFNTELSKVDSLMEEQAENERFRQHALGNFRDLLLASANYLPMTIYLDNDSNVVGAPNENYSRELMELHTMGVNNGYTQADIEEASRCFTGWTVIDGKFTFNPGLHDYGEKNLLGITIPAGGGISDGMALIEHLLGRQETADFIAWKLCQVFIADDPPADVVTAAATAFHNSNGDIKTTLTAIFTHARFRTDTAYRGNKTKTPLEFATGLIRMTEAHPVTTSLIYYLERMGMNLFEYADPTGFAEESVAWIDTNSMLERWNLVNDVTSNRGHGMTPALDLHRFFGRYGDTGSDGILDFFENLTTHGTQPAGVRAIAESWLTDDNPGAFSLTDEVLDNRVRQTLSLYLRLPELNKQ